MGAFLSRPRSSFALAGYQLLLDGGRGLVGLAWKLPKVSSKLWVDEGSLYSSPVTQSLRIGDG